MARILLIEDEDVLRRLVARILVAEGHEVIEARHGKEALRLNQAQPADLVITDIVMPEQDGLEVIMTLRRESPTLKVIAMSGGGRFKQMEALEMAMPLGAFASLQKPFQIEDMIQIVRQALAA